MPSGVPATNHDAAKFHSPSMSKCIPTCNHPSLSSHWWILKPINAPCPCVQMKSNTTALLHLYHLLAQSVPLGLSFCSLFLFAAVFVKWFFCFVLGYREDIQHQTRYHLKSRKAATFVYLISGQQVHSLQSQIPEQSTHPSCYVCSVLCESDSSLFLSPTSSSSRC